MLYNYNYYISLLMCNMRSISSGCHSRWLGWGVRLLDLNKIVNG